MFNDYWAGTVGPHLPFITFLIEVTPTYEDGIDEDFLDFIYGEGQ